MGLFSRREDSALSQTTAALLAQHQTECGDRYKEITRSIEKLNARMLGFGIMIISGMAYIIFSLLHSRGVW